VSQKSSRLLTVYNFVKSWPIFNILHCWIAYEICYKAHPTLSATPPHFRHVATLPWETTNSSFLQMWKKTQTNWILMASNFVIYPQILVLSVFIIANLSPYCLQIKFSMSLFFSLFTFAINLWHQKLVTAGHCSVCQQPTWYSATRTRFSLKVCIWSDTQQRGWQTNFLRKPVQRI